MRQRLILILMVCSWSACASVSEHRSSAERGRSAASAAPLARPALLAAAPFDVSAVIDQVRGMFRREGERYVTEQRGYRAQVDGERARVETRDGSAGVSVHTASIRRGKTELSLTPGALRGSERGLSRTQSAEVEEQLEVYPAGIAHSWTFARAPRGQGALEVRVALDNVRYLANDAAGLRFSALGSAPGAFFRFGHGTWIDARKREWPVPARWSNGEVVLSVPESVLRASAWPATLDPVVGPEQALREGGIGPLSHTSEVALGFDGQQYLVVWSEHDRVRKALVATRVTQTGKVLDPYGIVLDETCCATHTVVSPSSNGFLVAWQRADQVFVRPVRADGSVPHATTTVAPTPSRAPKLAFDGTNHLIVYNSWNDLYGVRLGPSGALLDSQLSHFGAANIGDVIFRDGAYFVVWSGDTPNGWTLFGQHVARDGVPVEDAPLSYGLGLEPQLIHDGSDMYLAFHRQPVPTNTDIFTVRLNAQGQLVSGSERPLATSAADERLIDASAGEQGLVWLYSAYENSAQAILMKRVRRGGTSVDAPPISLGPTRSPTADDAAIVAGREGYLLVMPTVGARLVPPTGPIYPFTDVGLARRRQMAPGVGYGGGNYLLVWSQLRSIEDGYDLLAVRVNRTGAQLDCEPMVLERGGYNFVAPRIAFDGARFLVVWTRSRENGLGTDLVGTFVGPGRAVSDLGGRAFVALASSAFDPAIAFDGTNYVMAWSDTRSGAENDIYAMRITPEGARLDGDGFAVATGGRHRAPRVASLVGTSLITWIDNPLQTTTFVQLARRLQGSTFLDASPITTSARRDGAVTAAAGVFHVFGFEQRNSAADTRLVGAQIQASTGAITTTVLDNEAVTRHLLEATFDGTRHVLAFEQWDYMNQQFVRAADTNGSTASLYTVVGPSEEVGPPALASAQDGTSLIAYHLYDDARPFVQQRVRYRMLGSTAQPTPLSCPPVSCESGYIVDGVCCDSPCGLGRPDDCMACSVALGAAQDGVCGYVSQGRACRAMTSTCPTPPQCTGQNLYCPEDVSGACTQPIAGVDAGVLFDAGLVSAPDAGSSVSDGGGSADTGSADGGVLQVDQRDAGSTTPTMEDSDSGARSDDDAASASAEGDAGPLGESEETAVSERPRKGGCHCSVPEREGRRDAQAWLTAFALLTFLCWRRSERRTPPYGPADTRGARVSKRSRNVG